MDQVLVGKSNSRLRGNPDANARWRRIIGRPETGAVGAAIVVFICFAATTDSFLTAGIWSSILSLASELGIVAAAGTLLMIAGEFDLSVGSIFGLAACLVPVLMNMGWPVYVAIIVTLLLMAAIGAGHGTLVTYVAVPSLIVTLGGLMFWRGLILQITGGFQVDVNDPEALKVFSASWNQFYVSTLWFALIVLALSLLLLRTQYGNWIFATGGNAKAALAVGIPVRRVKIMLFALSSVLAGFAGIVQMARYSSVDALRGTGYELQVILAAVIGGAILTGGRGSIVGTAMGCLMLGMLQQGLILHNISANWYQAGVGLLLIVAVCVNIFISRRADR